MEMSGYVHAPVALPPRKRLSILNNSRLGGPYARSWTFRVEEILLSQPRIEPRFLSCRSHSLVTPDYSDIPGEAITSRRNLRQKIYWQEGIRNFQVQVRMSQFGQLALWCNLRRVSPLRLVINACNFNYGNGP
jgi:hypothetical protein